MNYRKKIGKYILLLIAIFVIGFIFALPCEPNDNWTCHGKHIESVSQPFILFSVMLIVTLLILLPFPEHVYKAWKRFAIIYLPLMVLWVFITPGTGGAFMGPDREGILYFTSAIYGIIFGLLIIYKIIRMIIFRLSKGK